MTRLGTDAKQLDLSIPQAAFAKHECLWLLIYSRVVQGVVIFLCFSPVSSSAQNSSVVFIGQFTISRNGSLLFQDNFEDGAPPPDAPNFANATAASHTVRGSMNESGGKLRLVTVGAGIIQSVGLPSIPLFQEQARLNTNNNPDSSAGLKQSVTFSASGIFDLTVLAVRREGYGIELDDRTATNESNDNAQLEVVNRQSDDGRSARALNVTTRSRHR